MQKLKSDMRCGKAAHKKLFSWHLNRYLSAGRPSELLHTSLSAALCFLLVFKESDLFSSARCRTLEPEKNLLSLRLHRWNKAPSSLPPLKLQAGSGLSCLPPTSKLLIPSRSCQVSWHGSPAFKAHFHSPLRLPESLQHLHPPLTWDIYHLLFSSEPFTCSLSLVCDKHFSWSVIRLSCHVSCCYFSMNSVIPR